MNSDSEFIPSEEFVAFMRFAYENYGIEPYSELLKGIWDCLSGKAPWQWTCDTNMGWPDFDSAGYTW